MNMHASRSALLLLFFLLHSLPPGRYVVAVSVPSKGPSQQTGYLRTCNPGTTSVAAAQPVALAIDVEPYRLTDDADLMERARSAASAVEVREGVTPLELRLVRLRPFVRDPQ